MKRPINYCIKCIGISFALGLSTTSVQADSIAQVLSNL